MKKEKKGFGVFVRCKRQEQEIGLREMAKKIGVSPTYLSKVERDEFGPPTEKRIRAIAEIIGCDADKLLAMAGRVSSDIADIIKKRPTETSVLLRSTKNLSAEEIEHLTRNVKKTKGD